MPSLAPWRWVVLALIVVGAGYFGGASSVIGVLSGAIGGYLVSSDRRKPD
jgi:hypothetical protein